MTPGRLSLLGAAAGIFLAAAPVLAQTPIEDPLDARDAKRMDRMEKVVRELRSVVFQLRDTGKPVVVQPADTEAQMQEQANRIGDLEQSLTRVNGSLENLTHELDQARRDNTALQAQLRVLSDRLAADEAKAQAAQTAAQANPGAGAAGDAQAAPPTNPNDAFAKARQLMLSGDYDNAEVAFSDFVNNFPDNPKTPEARYWWGKTLAARGDQARAAGAFIGAIRGWPQTAWAPDAVVELARALVALKKPADACQTLAELGRRYPKAPPAVTGRAQATRAEAKCGA